MVAHAFISRFKRPVFQQFKKIHIRQHSFNIQDSTLSSHTRENLQYGVTRAAGLQSKMMNIVNQSVKHECLARFVSKIRVLVLVAVRIQML